MTLELKSSLFYRWVLFTASDQSENPPSLHLWSFFTEHWIFFFNVKLCEDSLLSTSVRMWSAAAPQTSQLKASWTRWNIFGCTFYSSWLHLPRTDTPAALHREEKKIAKPAITIIPHVHAVRAQVRLFRADFISLKRNASTPVLYKLWIALHKLNLGNNKPELTFSHEQYGKSSCKCTLKEGTEPKLEFVLFIRNQTMFIYLILPHTRSDSPQLNHS